MSPPGHSLPWRVRFSYSSLYSSLLEDPKIERKVLFLESFCNPDRVALVRSIGVCWKHTQRLDCLEVTGIDGVICFVEVEG